MSKIHFLPNLILQRSVAMSLEFCRRRFHVGYSIRVDSMLVCCYVSPKMGLTTVGASTCAQNYAAHRPGVGAWGKSASKMNKNAPKIQVMVQRNVSVSVFVFNISNTT